MSSEYMRKIANVISESAPGERFKRASKPRGKVRIRISGSEDERIPDGEYTVVRYNSDGGITIIDLDNNDFRNKKIYPGFFNIDVLSGPGLYEETNPVDTILMDSVTMIRIMELVKEDIADDADLHRLASVIVSAASDGHCLTMDDYDTIISQIDLPKD